MNPLDVLCFPHDTKKDVTWKEKANTSRFSQKIQGVGSGALAGNRGGLKIFLS